MFALLAGLLSALQQILMNIAIQLEDAGKVSLIKSTDLVFVFLLQLIILGIHPNLYSTTGAISIFVGVILIMIYKIVDNQHEKKLKLLSIVKNSKRSMEQNETETSVTCLKRSRSVVSGIFFYKF